MQSDPILRHTNWYIRLLILAIAYAFLSGTICGQTDIPKPAAPVFFSVAPTDSFPYQLNNPSSVIRLDHPSLREISGLSPANVRNQLWAVADERGELFLINLSDGLVNKQVLFREKGDFEGVEWVGETLYAVKSDGDLYSIKNWRNPDSTQIEYVDTPLNKENDVEGLCYDARRHALLLALKGNPDSSYTRYIYAFYLNENQLAAEPVYRISPAAVNQLVPYQTEDKANYFSPSAIAIHPITRDIYVLSSALKRLVALDYETGALKFAARIDKTWCPQPEGIAFDESGRLYISTEGKKIQPSIFCFDYISGR